MKPCVVKDMSWSSTAFEMIVWPTISERCGGGEIERVEGLDKARLDIYAGIDAWQYVSKDGAMRGIASRVQYDTGKYGYPYNTFTIRWSRQNSKTEYEKRRDAIFGKMGYVWPYFTVQAYLDNEKTGLVSCGVIKTKDLYSFVDLYGTDGFKTVENKDGSSSFKIVPWDMLNEYSVDVFVFSNGTEVIA